MTVVTGASFSAAPGASAPGVGAPGVGAPRHHIITVLVENKSGVLARVAGLFSRRGYNIFSLAVAPTDNDRLARITIVVDVESAPLEQIVQQLDKLINVVSISQLAPEAAVEPDILLATVAVGLSSRDELVERVDGFGGEVVNVGAGELTVMLADAPRILDDFEGLLRDSRIVELQR